MVQVPGLSELGKVLLFCTVTLWLCAMYTFHRPPKSWLEPSGPRAAMSSPARLSGVVPWFCTLKEAVMVPPGATALAERLRGCVITSPAAVDASGIWFDVAVAGSSCVLSLFT